MSETSFQVRPSEHNVVIAVEKLLMHFDPSATGYRFVTVCHRKS